MTIKVNLPDGNIAQFPDGTPHDVMEKALQEHFAVQGQPQAPQGDMPWSEVPGQALANAPASAMNFGKAMAQPIVHPIDTTQNVGDLAAGALRLGMRATLPEGVTKYIEGTDTDPAAADRQVKAAQAVGSFYKDRYGSEEGFKKALATDPIGVMADFATVLTGGGAAMSKVGPLAKAGSIASTAGAELNPLTQVSRLARGTGKLGQNVLGMTTGTSADTIGEAYRAGRTGGPQGDAFRRNLRGHEDQAVVIDQAHEAMGNLKDAQGTQYRKDMQSINADKTPIDFKPIEKAFDGLVDDAYTGSPNHQHQKASDQAIKKLNEIYGVLAEWQDDPSMHTAGGLDALKQRLDNLMPPLTDRTKDSVRAVTAIRNTVKDAIVQQAPEYAKAMANYEKSANIHTELEKSLGLGKKVSADATLRRMQSITRNNANTNYGGRVKNAKILEEAGAKTLMPSLAGQALNTLMPRGLRGPMAAAALTGLGTYFSPLAVPGLLAGSPRLVGEATHLAGRLGRRANQLPIPKRGGLLGLRAIGGAGLLGQPSR